MMVCIAVPTWYFHSSHYGIFFPVPDIYTMDPALKNKQKHAEWIGIVLT